MRISKIVERYIPKRRATLLLYLCMGISFLLITLSVYQSRYSLGSDGISYISIAEHYERGDIKTAINGYWSPMISWLIAPLIAVGIEGRLAFVIINGLAAITTVILGSLIIWRNSHRSNLAVTVFIIGSTLFLISTISSLFPDLLLTAWVVLFLLVLIHTEKVLSKSPEQIRVLRLCLTLAIVGVVGYLIKIYAAPFFIATIMSWGLLRALMEYRAKAARTNGALLKAFAPSSLAIVLFILMSLPWAAALSIKYGYFTYGSSLSVNTSTQFDAPQVPARNTTDKKSDELKLKSEEDKKITKPPYETAITTTEDRTPIKNKQSYLPGGGANLSIEQKISNYLARRKQGIPLYFENLQSLWMLLVAIPVLTGCTLFIKRQPYRAYSHYYILLLAFLVYFFGYALIAGSRGGNPRYYWPLLIMSLLVACLSVSNLQRNVRLAQKKKLPLLLSGVIVASLYITYPLPRLNKLFSAPKPTVLETIAYDFKTSRDILPYEDFLSNNSRQNRLFAFYVRGQALGSLGADHRFTDNNNLNNMEMAGVDYFLHFSNREELEFIPEQYGGSIIEKYYLGNKYPDCIDSRDSSYQGKCTLYVIKPNY